MGVSALFLPILAGVFLLAHPGWALDPRLVAFFLAFAAIGASVVALGLLIGRRTRWKIPDPKVARPR